MHTCHAQIAGTYHYAVRARAFVKAGLFGPTLVGGTMMLVGVVENLGVVVINVISSEDVGYQFQGRGLSNTSLPHKKDSVWRFRLVLRCLDYPLLERFHVAGNTVRGATLKDSF